MYSPVQSNSETLQWLTRLPFVCVEVYLNPQMLSEVGEFSLVDRVGEPASPGTAEAILSL
jgi:hypothetical protein